MATDMKGSLSRNQKREHDKQPEFRGSACIHGTEFWISAWIREGDDGSKYFSLSFREKEQPKSETHPQASPELKSKYGSNTSPQRPYQARTLDDDSIPF